MQETSTTGNGMFFEENREMGLADSDRKRAPEPTGLTDLSSLGLHRLNSYMNKKAKFKRLVPRAVEWFSAQWYGVWHTRGTIIFRYCFAEYFAQNIPKKSVQTLY